MEVLEKAWKWRDNLSKISKRDKVQNLRYQQSQLCRPSRKLRRVFQQDGGEEGVGCTQSRLFLCAQYPSGPYMFKVKRKLSLYNEIHNVCWKLERSCQLHVISDCQQNLVDQWWLRTKTLFIKTKQFVRHQTKDGDIFQVQGHWSFSQGVNRIWNTISIRIQIVWK